MEEKSERRAMVVRPMEVFDSATKVLNFVVSSAFRCVQDIVMVSVAIVQELRNLNDLAGYGFLTVVMLFL